MRFVSKNEFRRWAPSLVPFAASGVLFGIGAVVVEGFADWPNVRSLLVIACFLGIASMGQTLVILLGGIDLSIPAVIGMADVITTHLYGQGVNFALVMVVVLGSGLVVGLVNGVAAQLLHAHTLIVTLATGSIVLGGVFLTTQGQNSGSVPPWLTSMVSPIGTVGPVPVPPIVVFWAVLTAGIIYLQRRTVLGRQIYASGANPLAATFALVRPTVVWPATFALSALCAAVTGMLLAGFSGGADPNVGAPYLFTTVAAVVVGGTSLVGGRGGYGRTVAGVLLITLLTTLLVGTGASDQVQQMLLGLLIVVMVGIYGRQPHVRGEI